jgi:hypothetical protein
MDGWSWSSRPCARTARARWCSSQRTCWFGSAPARPHLGSLAPSALRLACARRPSTSVDSVQLAGLRPLRFNLIRYFGVLSSHSRCRARVVPSLFEPSRFAPEAAAGDQLELGFGSADSAASASAPSHGRSRWGWLLAHVFRADVDTCVRCGGPMRWVEVATEPAAIARLLAKHRVAPEPARARRTRTASGQLPLPFA